MNEDLLRFNKKQKYLIFDYETCNLNLNSKDNKPWQLSYIVADFNKIFEEQDFYLKWEDLKISDEAKKITGFNQSKYKKSAKDPAECLKSFENWLYNKDVIPVGHNILGFDVYIHNIHRNLCSLKPDFSYVDRCIDTNCIAKAVAENIKNKNKKSRISWQYSLNNFRKRGLKTSLKACANKYKIEFDEKKLHNALYDINLNYQVLKKQLWDIEI